MINQEQLFNKLRKFINLGIINHDNIKIENKLKELAENDIKREVNEIIENFEEEINKRVRYEEKPWQFGVYYDRIKGLNFGDEDEGEGKFIGECYLDYYYDDNNQRYIQLQFDYFKNKKYIYNVCEKQDGIGQKLLPFLLKFLQDGQKSCGIKGFIEKFKIDLNFYEKVLVNFSL